MERFIQLFADFLSLVYHCFDRIVIHGYLSGLSRPEQVVYFVPDSSTVQEEVSSDPGRNHVACDRVTENYDLGDKRIRLSSEFALGRRERHIDVDGAAVEDLIRECTPNGSLLLRLVANLDIYNPPLEDDVIRFEIERPKYWNPS